MSLCFRLSSLWHRKTIPMDFDRHALGLVPPPRRLSAIVPWCEVSAAAGHHQLHIVSLQVRLPQSAIPKTSLTIYQLGAQSVATTSTRSPRVSSALRKGLT